MPACARRPDRLGGPRVARAVVLACRARFQWGKSREIKHLDDINSVVEDVRVPGTSLVGRDAELTRLNDWLDGGERLVTLTGSGGIGKTRLALALVEQRRTRGPLLFVELGATGSAIEAMTSLARALGTGVSGASADDMARALGRALRARGPILVVLDELDAVVAELGRVLDGWLDAAPGAAFVVTSRERLVVAGERVLVVPPLPTDGGPSCPAVALFLDRAARAGADVAYAPSERQALGDLVRRLDGLPLAIEIAAARADVWPPSRLLVELGHRFDVLAGDRPGVRDQRHASMRAAVDFSWALLADDAKLALARLGVLSGPFDLAAAAAVMDLGELAALAQLELLGRRSLVVVGRGDAGLHLLETIRDFAREQAVALGVEGEAVARRDAWFVARAEALLEARRTTGGAVAARALGHLHEQLRAIVREHGAGGSTHIESALRAAFARTASMRMAAVSEPDGAGVPELAELAERAAAAGVDRALVVKAMLLSARLLYDHARLDEGLALARRTLAVAGPDPRWLPEVTLMEGRHAFIAGRFEEAQARFGEGRALAAAVGDQEMEGIALVNLAMTRMRVGRPAGALEELDRAHALLVAAGALNQLPLQLGVVFFVASGLGERGRARAALVEGLRVARDVGSVRDEIGLGVYLALAELDDGQLASARDGAAAAFEKAVVAHERLAGQCATLLAQIEIERGGLDEAERWHAAGRRLLSSSESEFELVRLDALEAARRALAGDLPGALALTGALDPQKLAGDNGISVTADGLRAIVFSADALACHRRGDRAGAAQRLAEVARLRERLAAYAGRGDDARRALALVDRVLAAARGGDDVLCVAPDLMAYRIGRRWEELGRKPVLQRLFAALVRAKVDEGGQPLSIARAAEAAWPGERMLDEARDNRLYVTLSKLRHAGLDAALEHDRGGWRLRPELGVLWLDPAAWELVDGD
ncbi:MAG: AAA family ATPase [Myxococcota bacterium]